MTLQPFSIDTVKGWTRCSCVAFIALAVSELDVNDDEVKPQLVPLHRVLDKAWLLPMHVPKLDLGSSRFFVFPPVLFLIKMKSVIRTHISLHMLSPGNLLALINSTEIALNMNKDAQSFRNLSLSFRGAERQAPTVLQIALRFSKIMERQSGSATGNTENRLKKVVGQFNSSPGLHVKHQIDSDKERTVLNLIVGTCKAHQLPKSFHIFLFPSKPQHQLGFQIFNILD